MEPPYGFVCVGFSGGHVCFFCLFKGKNKLFSGQLIGFPALFESYKLLKTAIFGLSRPPILGVTDLACACEWVSHALHVR